MKICVLGLDGAAPEVIFGDERLVNLRRLMDLGVYGSLESVVPPDSVPAWMCMSTSQDPGSLGIYGVRNRSDHSYDKPALAGSASIKEFAIWDHLAREGKKSIIIGVPPNYPPREVNGISIGCFLTPDTAKNDFTYPPSLKAQINELVGEYPVDVKEIHSAQRNSLKQEIFDMCGKHWAVVRWLLTDQEWDYFHFVDLGLDRIQHGFWNYFDPRHVRYEPDNPYQDAIPEYYRLLDEQIGSVLEILDEETILLVVSDHGAQRLDGGFALNEWLIREGLLVLHEYPTTLTPFEELKVNWSRTKVWSDGGSYAPVFFNVQGREPQGVVPASQYKSFQDDMKARLENLPCEDGRLLKSKVLKPQEIYRDVRNVAPDLIVQFGDLYWRSVSTVGHTKLHLPEDEYCCNQSLKGMFILTAPNCPLSGEFEGARLLDLAPTLLDLAGHEIRDTVQGRSLVAGMEKKRPGGGSDEESQRIIHDRLAGLGYV
jgi:predicted AlkP superfamily phosphohydrolase/phosphomutase